MKQTPVAKKPLKSPSYPVDSSGLISPSFPVGSLLGIPYNPRKSKNNLIKDKYQNAKNQSINLNWIEEKG